MANHQKEITQYYDDLAKDYDKNRFHNSYGRFIHQQEALLLQKYIHDYKDADVLNLGCGTGRFMEMANFGLDISANMLAEAEKKYPSKNFIQADATQTSFPDTSFDAIFSMHVLMHLEKEQFSKILKESFRLLRKGGRFIFDVPSSIRRNISGGHSKASWHGSTSYSIQELKEQTKEKWDWIGHHGMMFLPIHRFPSSIRPHLFSLDNFLCRTFAADYSSYIFIILEKKE